MNNKRAFTLLEMMVAITVMAILLSIGYKLLSASQKGAMHGREASVHLYSGEVVAMALESDFSNVIPFEINTDKGRVAGPVSFSPDNKAADSVLFWTLADSGVKQVRYSFDQRGRFILREEVDATGQAQRSQKFGEGMVSGFVIKDESGEAETVLVTIEMEGKERKTVINKVFCHGLIKKNDCRHWIFHF